MRTYSTSSKVNGVPRASDEHLHKNATADSLTQFVDNRPETVAYQTVQRAAATSRQTRQTAQLRQFADSHADPFKPKENRTGLPDELKAGIENLSGYSMDDVNVHFNSDKPATLQAHAYAQGTDIHVAPGQEKYLPHEAWHVVQQMQGRVRPTMQMKAGLDVNDDDGLEKEADRMGQLAAQSVLQRMPERKVSQGRLHVSHVVQRVQVFSTDVGKYYQIVRGDNGLPDTGQLVSIDGGGWYTFDNVSGNNGVRVRGQNNIIQEVSTPSTPMFSVGGISFNYPVNFSFTSASALRATQSVPHGGWGILTGQPANSGVSVGDYGSYGGVQYLEQTGDGLTGDHQPSGAAIKEAIRLELHNSLAQVLTRGMAKNAYKKAITVVVTDVWHKAYSRTYGGRNNPTQIAGDAADLVSAAILDWQLTVPHLQSEGLTDQDIRDIWDGMNRQRQAFFNTGDEQY